MQTRWNRNCCGVFFSQIFPLSTVAVNPRVRCLLEPVWSWGHRGRGKWRLVQQQSPRNFCVSCVFSVFFFFIFSSSSDLFNSKSNNGFLFLPAPCFIVSAHYLLSPSCLLSLPLGRRIPRSSIGRTRRGQRPLEAV